MITIDIDIKPYVPYMREEAMRVAETASRYEASVMLQEDTSVINLKSVIGLLSMAITGQKPVQLVCKGRDETEAAQAVKKALLSEKRRTSL